METGLVVSFVLHKFLGFVFIKQPSLQIRSTDVLIYYSKTNSFGSLMELFIPFVKTFTRVKQAKQNFLLKFCLKQFLLDDSVCKGQINVYIKRPILMMKLESI